MSRTLLNDIYPHVTDTGLLRRIEFELGRHRTVFDTLSLDRGKVHWEDYLDALTPVELVRNTDGREMHFKRDDYFAPLGYRGINGSKLRHMVYVFSRYMEPRKRIVIGASVRSPQLPLCAACARHFGREAVAVLGNTRPDSCRRNEMVDLAYRLGCRMEFVNVGYNNCLQSRCRQLAFESPGDVMCLEYGMMLEDRDYSLDEICQFHDVGARQVRNMPRGITDLVIPLGSGVSSASILLGLAKYGYRDIRRLHLIGIGPSKLSRMTDRLELMNGRCGADCCIFDGLPYTMKFSIPSTIRISFYDLFGEKYCHYIDRMPFKFGDVELCPTYEGKMMTYIYERMPDLVRDTTLFWITGSELSREVILGCISDLEDV